MNRREFLKFTAALTAAAASLYVGVGGILKAKPYEGVVRSQSMKFHDILQQTFNMHSKVWKMCRMETLRAEEWFGHVVRGMVVNEHSFKAKYFSFMYEEASIADLDYRKTLLKNIFSAISQAIRDDRTTKIKGV